jgi:hypothetical protein
MLTAMHFHLFRGIFHPGCNICTGRAAKNVNSDIQQKFIRSLIGYPNQGTPRFDAIFGVINISMTISGSFLDRRFRNAQQTAVLCRWRVMAVGKSNRI